MPLWYIFGYIFFNIQYPSGQLLSSCLIDGALQYKGDLSQRQMCLYYGYVTYLVEIVEC